MLRLGDVFSRLHVTTKAGTLGLAGILLASLLFFAGQESGITVKQLLTLVFVFLTAPVSAHLLSSAAYRIGTQQWDRTRMDEAAPYLARHEVGTLLPDHQGDEGQARGDGPVVSSPR